MKTFSLNQCHFDLYPSSAIKWFNLLLALVSLAGLSGCATFEGLDGGANLPAAALPARVEVKLTPERHAALLKRASPSPPSAVADLFLLFLPSHTEHVWNVGGLGLSIQRQTNLALPMLTLYKHRSTAQFFGDTCNLYTGSSDLLFPWLLAPLVEISESAIQEPALGDTYSYKRSCILVLGALGWGRVNHRFFLQFLWIPIPTGNVGA